MSPSTRARIIGTASVVDFAGRNTRGSLQRMSAANPDDTRSLLRSARRAQDVTLASLVGVLGLAFATAYCGHLVTAAAIGGAVLPLLVAAFLLVHRRTAPRHAITTDKREGTLR